MTMISPDDGRPSVSRTARYKKVTKPLLERKRRARINRCLDELKDLMVGAFEVEGDNISKLEKADILELTVRHLTKLHSPRDPIADAKRFQAGFGQCAAEACQFILSMPDVDSQIGQNLVQHLSSQINEGPLSVQVPTGRNFSPPVSPEAPTVWSSPINRDDPRDLHNDSAGKNTRYSLNNSCSVTYEKRIREDVVPHVPINQSLVCDIATFNSSPTVHELSRPLAGLLMTVDTDKDDLKSHFRRPEVLCKNDVERMRINRESDIIHNAKTKNIIIKKIREQILERQVKEIESKPLSSSSSSGLSRELPSYANIESHYQLSANDVPTKRSYKRKHEKVEITNSSETIDLRKKSKGEAKHFSPAMIDVTSNHDSFQEATQNQRQFSNSSQTSYIHESLSSINDPNYYSRDRCYEKNPTFPNTRESDPESVSSHAEQYTTQKRQADYRSIHPKKAIIRTPKLPEESEINLRQETSRYYRVPIENYDQPSRSSLREQRFSNMPQSLTESSSKHHHELRKDFNRNDRQNKRVMNYEHMNTFGNFRSRHEEYERNTQAGRIDQQYIRPLHPNQEQDDEDESMWRPW